MDEPNLQLQKYLSHDKSAINYAGQTDRVLDDLYDKQSGELDKKKRIALLREFEKRALEQAYTIPTIWWHRIIVHQQEAEGLAHHAVALRGAGPGRRLAGIAGKSGKG